MFSVIKSAILGGMVASLWGFPLDFTLASIADLVIGWFLAGLVIAKVS